MLASSICFEEP